LDLISIALNSYRHFADLYFPHDSSLLAVRQRKALLDKACDHLTAPTGQRRQTSEVQSVLAAMAFAADVALGNRSTVLFLYPLRRAGKQWAYQGR
jgi:hypothetical protein